MTGLVERLKGARVLVTGGSGFKGSWLCRLLLRLGASVYDVSLPRNDANLFEAPISSHCGRYSFLEIDIRDASRLRDTLTDIAPDFIVHMAAQALVLESYSDPIGTYSTNVIGTLNVLEAVRYTPSVRLVLNVTTDKVYRNFEVGEPFKELDLLGGLDPYSSSKSCADILGLAYHKSFLEDLGVSLINLRAGNVIGGGDWSRFRLIPDTVRALVSGEKLVVRSPESIRPWQHVVEPVLTYVRLLSTDHNAPVYREYNIGPLPTDCLSVGEVVSRAKASFPSLRVTFEEAEIYESRLLSLDCSKIHHELNIFPLFSATEALDMTFEWYRAWLSGEDMTSITAEQLEKALERCL